MIGRKNVCFPTQPYNAPYGKFGIKFVLTLSVELDDILSWKCNADQVVIFQSIILQRVRPITYAKHICV